MVEVLGGEPRVLYDCVRNTTIMIASNFSSYHGKDYSCLFVASATYLGYETIYLLARDDGHIFIISKP